MSSPIVFVGAKRTPFGSFGGSLKNFTATDLATFASQGAIQQAQLDPSAIDHVIFGNVLQSAKDAIYLARHVGLRCRVPESVPAFNVNRACGSGFEALASACRLIRTGDANVILAGGTESMSQAPYVLRGARFGYRMNHNELEDTLVAGLHDDYAGIPMGMTAENLAEKYEISREQCDAYALRSQTAAFEATQAKLLSEEIVPIPIREKKTERVLSEDESIRAETNLASLAKLRPVFKKNGVVTAGNASGISDGAAALILTTEDRAKSEGWEILGYWLENSVKGCDPKIMGIGPVPTIQALLEKTQLSLDEIHAIEINEAFAPQYLAVEKALNLKQEKVNIHGGAIALGHPLGASGARLVLHLLYQLKRKGSGLGLASACIGGGQGQAILVRC